MHLVALITEVVIFVSYSILSLIVFELYTKSFRNSAINYRVICLVILTSMFLMLCALTHINSVWGGGGDQTFRYLCAVASAATAVVALNLRGDVHETLTNRFRAVKLVKDETILDLMKGYHLRINVEKGLVVKGTIDNVSMTHPRRLRLSGEIKKGDVVDADGRKFRIIHKIYENMSLVDNNDIEAQERRDYSLFGVDVTEECKNRDLLEKSNSKKLALCLSTAHDIRTPLTSISYLSSTFKEISLTDEDSRKRMEEFNTHVELLNLLATQLMDAGRILGGYSLIPTQGMIDIRSMFKKLETISPYMHEDAIKFHLKVDEGVPPRIVSDEQWVWQILLNFVTNAFKYTQSGDVWVECSVHTDREETHQLTIRVSDTGIGVSERDRKRLFDMFVDIQTHEYGNKGVGLFTVDTKVKALEGRCSMEPNEHGGSTFRATFPVLTELPEAGEREGRMSSCIDDRQKTFLVVDDTDSILRVMQRSLREHRVDVARNGGEALHMMLKKDYDIVFMDLSMPVMDGVQCVTAFREHEDLSVSGERLFVVMMSATGIDRPDLFDDKLPKPLDMKALKRMVDSVVI